MLYALTYLSGNSTDYIKRKWNYKLNVCGMETERRMEKCQSDDDDDNNDNIWTKCKIVKFAAIQMFRLIFRFKWVWIINYRWWFVIYNEKKNSIPMSMCNWNVLHVTKTTKRLQSETQRRCSKCWRKATKQTYLKTCSPLFQ